MRFCDPFAVSPTQQTNSSGRDHFGVDGEDDAGWLAVGKNPRGSSKESTDSPPRRTV